MKNRIRIRPENSHEFFSSIFNNTLFKSRNILAIFTIITLILMHILIREAAISLIDKIFRRISDPDLGV